MTRIRRGEIPTRRPVPQTQHCHVLIAKTAKDLTGAKYELLMGNDLLYKEWKELHPGLSAKQLLNKFISTYWGNMVDEARAILTDMLNGPYAEEWKEEIADALIKDNSIRGRSPRPM